MALQPIGGRRAAVLEGIAIGLEALKGEIALFAGDRTNAVNRALLGMDDRVSPLGVEARVMGLDGS
ncbi:hypothetical protein [Lamprobacter modestohalophilus]|uniref:hypothetical protein n=1 Tax=Lamprobacter modestohalophilus TaxID=1064514 RepID=UPI002ADED7BD|nr:hypothetical protein [Lamprobacter modestohalophilus]